MFRSTPIQASIMNLVMDEAYGYLYSFIRSPFCIDHLILAFGDQFSRSRFRELAQAWEHDDFSRLPSIQIRRAAEINGAAAAYSRDTDTVYVSQELVKSGNSSLLLSVILEEFGHYIDAHINDQETPGDEGALFALLAQGKQPSAKHVAALKAKDDGARIYLDGRWIAIEQSSYVHAHIQDSWFI